MNPTMMPTTCPSPDNGFVYHPPNFHVFTDIGSIGHLALGWFAGGLPGPDALAIFSIFTGYQLTQSATGESWPRIGGELLEFGLGMLIARFTQTRTSRASSS